MTITNKSFNRAGLAARFAGKLLLMAFLACMVALPAAAGGRYFRGGFVYGPAWRPWGYPYDPFFYGGVPIVTYPNAGQVKVETKINDAAVYVNGSYAGTVGTLKSFWLRQGSYNLQVRFPGYATFAERIYVVPGKTLHIHPELRAEVRP